MKLNELLLEDEDIGFATTVEQIQKAMSKFKIYKHQYTINEDMTVDIYDCHISQIRRMKRLPVRFGLCKGNFSLNECDQLQSLEGCPHTVKGVFSLTSLKSITTLKGSPKVVNYDYHLEMLDRLESLEGMPSEIGGQFSIESCDKIKNLDHGPSAVGVKTTARKAYTISDCVSLASIKGVPKQLMEFWLNGCDKITSFEDFPSHIDQLFISNQEFTSLEGISDHVKSVRRICFNESAVKRGGIGLLLIDGLKIIQRHPWHGKKLMTKHFQLIERYHQHIINGDGEFAESLFDCQEELLKEGFEAFAIP